MVVTTTKEEVNTWAPEEHWLSPWVIMHFSRECILYHTIPSSTPLNPGQFNLFYIDGVG